MDDVVKVAGAVRPYTTKQMGDACEMLIAAELTLAGVPAMKAPDFWPGYDIAAQPIGGALQRISVKARTHAGDGRSFRFDVADVFDWIALVIVPVDQSQRRRIFILPGDVARNAASKAESGRQRLSIRRVLTDFANYEDNFTLTHHSVGE